MKPKTRYDWWTIPDYEEVHWFNESGEQATIKSILNGTASVRSWSDIQSTWCYSSKPKPRVIRVIKSKKLKKVRVKKEKLPRGLNRLAYILSTNGMSMDVAVETAIRLLS